MYSILIGPGKYTLKQPKDGDTGAALSGGSGTVSWYNDTTGALIAGAVAVTWNAALLRYESQIEDSSVWPRALGELWRGEILIDATTPSAKRYRDVLKARIRAPSSGI